MHDFNQIALALKYIHDRKVLHRDLKVENVFLMKDGTIKLGDFGIARVLEHTFQLCHTQIGTPYYLSPEICEGKKYNSKTDIWSLGCILYELLTLKRPFDAADLNSLLMVIVRGRYQPVSVAYSRDLRTLLSKMLTKDPTKRPSINQILGLPFIKQQLSSFLDQTLLDYEMSHTVLHGRLPLATPTVVLPGSKPQTPVPPAPRQPASKVPPRGKTPLPTQAQPQSPSRLRKALVDDRREQIEAEQVEEGRRRKEREAEKRRLEKEAADRQRIEKEAAGRQRIEKEAAERHCQAEREAAGVSPQGNEDKRPRLVHKSPGSPNPKPPIAPIDEEEKLMAVLPGKRAKHTEDGIESLMIQPSGRPKLIIIPPEELRIQEPIKMDRPAGLAGDQRRAIRKKPDESPDHPAQIEPIDTPPSPQRIAAVKLQPKRPERLLDQGKLELIRKSIQDDPEEGEKRIMRQMQSQSEVADRIMEALQLARFEDGDAEEGFEADEQENVFFIGDHLSRGT
jgi:hypothetical protein